MPLLLNQQSPLKAALAVLAADDSFLVSLLAAFHLCKDTSAMELSCPKTLDHMLRQLPLPRKFETPPRPRVGDQHSEQVFRLAEHQSLQLRTGLEPLPCQSVVSAVQDSLGPCRHTSGVAQYQHQYVPRNWLLMTCI